MPPGASTVDPAPRRATCGAARAVAGPRVLVSKPALSLLCFAVLLTLVLVVPSPVRERFWSDDDPSAAGPGTRARAPSLPGLPAPPRVPAGGGTPAGADGEDDSEQVAIEDPRGVMKRFYAALRRVAAGKREVVRVLHYGDSLIDLDHITGALRRRLVKRFGDGGHGFVLAAKPWRWYNHPGINLGASDEWDKFRLVGGRRRDGRLGLGCAAIQSRGGRAWVVARSARRVRSSRVEVHYLAMPGGGGLRVAIDGKRAARLSTAGPRREAAFRAFDLPEAAHRVRLVARGKVRLFGLVFERAGPGITWENLPLISARFHQLALLDAAHWKAQLRRRDPRLVVFQFGANDTIAFGGSLKRYGARIGVVLDRLREAVPGASCLIIGPLDRLERGPGGKLVSPEVVQKVSRRQREVGLAHGCAFFDGQRAMGGPGSMKRWLARGLALKDRVHLNPRGSRLFARRLERALLAGYAASR